MKHLEKKRGDLNGRCFELFRRPIWKERSWQKTSSVGRLHACVLDTVFCSVIHMVAIKAAESFKHGKDSAYSKEIR